MNLLTFLGVAPYAETTYVLRDQRHQTRYCGAAMARFLKPERTLVVVTKKAHEMHFEALADELSTVTRPQAVPIPDGSREEELWQIFDALTDEVPEGSELIADITNGFRSLPFLSFLAVAYLRAAKAVQVPAVYYGAYEARTEQNESPIFDLTPFVGLLDWVVATDRFTRFGDARDLASLLRAGMPAGIQMGSDIEARRLGNGLKASAQAMESVSLALRLTRPLESMETALRLVQTMQDQRAIIEPKSRPFAVLSQNVVDTYQSFALADSTQPTHQLPNLRIQLDMVEWYLEKEQVIQAVTLAREWLVSLLVHRLAAGSLVERAAREPIENALNNAAERRRGGTRHPLPTPFDGAVRDMPQCQELGEVWDGLSRLRNDLAHVGMRSGASPAATLLANATELCPRLRRLADDLLPADDTE